MNLLIQSAPSLELKHNQVTIWSFSLENSNDLFDSILSKEEQQRATRFYFETHRSRFIAAHAILRIILSKYLNANSNQLNFLHNKQGKPYLNESLQFNMSHSKNRALLAVGNIYPLGVDIEYFSKRSYLGIGDYLFSNEESRALKSLKKMQIAQGFFSLWTQKEALMKACGVGLSYPTRDLTLRLFPQESYQFIDPVDTKEWKMLGFFPEVAAMGALCMHPSIETVLYCSLKKEQIEKWLE